MRHLWIFLFIFFFTYCEDRDLTPPDVQIISPLNNAVVYEEVDIKCIATDNEGVKLLTLWINGNETSISDTTEPYLLEWNTVFYDNGEYLLRVKAEDNSGNVTDSDPVKVKVDNSLSIPKPIDVETVTYNKEKLSITWKPYLGDDFNRYDIYRVDDDIEELIGTIYQQEVGLFELTDFNPNIENWFYIKIVDKYGFNSFGKGKSNTINEPPVESEIFIPVFDNNNLEIKWTKNYDWDFEKYELFDLNENRLIHSGNNREDTTYIIHNFPLDTKRKYGLKVHDHWSLVSNPSEINGSSYQKIIYTDKIYGNKELNEILVMDIDGFEKHVITKNKNLKKFLSFSSNGKYIVYDQTTTAMGSGSFDIYVSEWTGQNVKNLTNNRSETIVNTMPEFSLDSEKVLYLSYSKPTNENFMNIMSVNIDGSNLVSLTPQGSFDVKVLISDNYIYFFHGKTFDEIDGLYRMDLNGGGRELIIDNQDGKLTYWSTVFSSVNSSDFYYTVYDEVEKMTNLYRVFGNDNHQKLIEIDQKMLTPFISDDGVYVYYYGDHHDLTKRGIYSLNLNNYETIFLLESGNGISDIHQDYLLVSDLFSENNHEIFLFEILNGSLSKLTNSAYDSSHPKFQPKK